MVTFEGGCVIGFPELDSSKGAEVVTFEIGCASGVFVVLSD